MLLELVMSSAGTFWMTNVGLIGEISGIVEHRSLDKMGYYLFGCPEI